MLISFMGHTMDSAINIEFFPSDQQISQLLKIQNTMPMSKAPKVLSKIPKALCFMVNIDEYLPKAGNIKPIYGCIFSDQVAMNASLLRAGLFVHTQMGMASDQVLFSSNLMKAVAGHDFNGEELFSYRKQRVLSEQKLPEHALLRTIEAEFDQKIIEPIIAKHTGNFIFFAIVNTKKFKENLSHELLHAQYYNDPEIEPILLKVWNEVQSADQNTIIDALKKSGYATEQQELLLREFYSYFLQDNAKDYLAGIPGLAAMSPLADVYGPKIKTALAVGNIEVLRLQ